MKPRASGSSITRAIDFAPSGALAQTRSGEVFAPSQVFAFGMAPPSANAVLVTLKGPADIGASVLVLASAWAAAAVAEAPGIAVNCGPADDGPGVPPEPQPASRTRQATSAARVISRRWCHPPGIRASPVVARSGSSQRERMPMRLQRRRFSEPSDVRSFPHGRVDVVEMDDNVIG